MAKLLVDECLHLSLIDLARGAGHVADHVNYLGLGDFKDWKVMAFILERDYTLVTNNRSDFLGLYNKESLHAGLIIIFVESMISRDSSHFCNKIVIPTGAYSDFLPRSTGQGHVCAFP